MITREELEQATVITVDQLAHALGCHRQMAYKMVRTGEVQSIRVGTAIKIPAAPIRQMLQMDDHLSRDQVGGSPDSLVYERENRPLAAASHNISH